MNNQLPSIIEALNNQPRLLIEAELRPVQGDRFQPTGFPDLGAATYKRPDGTPMLLIESAQSMANRMEAACWDDATNRIVPALSGLPHIVVDLGNDQTTSSIQEAHRLNSPYIINDKTLKSSIIGDLGKEDGPLDIRQLAQVIFNRDVGAVLHGVFIAQKDIFGGRARLQRLLSSFIEAEGVNPVTSGGVKLDRVNPSGNAAEGYGNVPFSRTEFVARKMIAYFNLDLATMRGYGLGDGANHLLIALALLKVLTVLARGLRLRTACDLEALDIRVTRPQGMEISYDLLEELSRELPNLIRACGFDEGSVTRIERRS